MATEKRLIYAEDILVGVETFKKCYRENASLYPIVEAALGALSMVTEFVNRTPTVDAEKVVYCEDCKYRVLDTVNGEDWCNHTLGLCSEVYATDFCCHGERKDDT